MVLYDRYNDAWVFHEIVKALTDENTDVMGDVNGDGSFNVADVVALQRWLLADSSAELKNWQAADLCKDNRLDVFDLCLMRRKLLEQM